MLVYEMNWRNICETLGSMSAGAGTGVRGTEIREFGKFKNMAISGGGIRQVLIYKKNILYMYLKSYIHI